MSQTNISRSIKHRIGLTITVFLSLFCLGQTSLIHAKATLAQVLMEHAWQRSVQSGIAQKPWPWADMKPTAVLTVPSLGIRQYVLNAHTGEALAFGPGILSNEDELAPVRILAGHRDTHFRFLKQLAPGDLIELEMLGKELIHYTVKSIDLLDTRKDRLPWEALESSLFLVTCYPFDAISNHGPLRYVLTAKETSHNH